MARWDDHETLKQEIDRLLAERMLENDRFFMPFAYWARCKFSSRWFGLRLFLFGYPGDNPKFASEIREYMSTEFMKDKSSDTNNRRTD